MSLKRCLSFGTSGGSNAKRPRVATESHQASPTDADEGFEESQTPVESLLPTPRHLARRGIQRSIALVLKHDGFSSASPEALESFTNLVETYMDSLVSETKRFALAARREHPTPPDFDLMLRYHNISTTLLKPHIKNLLPKRDLRPTYTDIVTTDSDALRTLPLLSSELSGQPDKSVKQFIPASFPEFPSRHTYKYTPQEETSSRDSQKIRQEAARAAQQGEDALRRLVRASKMRKQKEVKSLVERDSEGKERFRLWESTMRRFMCLDGRGDNASLVDIADHSMIVNGDAAFSRKEVSRLGKRSAGLSVSRT